MVRRRSRTNLITIIIAIRAPRGKGDDEDGSDEESEEESSEEESSEEEAPAAGGSAEAQPELSRAERKEQKKKQAAAKAAKTGEDEEDEDLINPNHVGKKLNISDLGAPRELSRRERYISFDTQSRLS
jgi:cobalamin biosynthesis protein CobT